MNYSDFLDDELELVLKGNADLKKKAFKTINLEKIEKILEILENYSHTSHKRLNIIKFFDKINIPVQHRHDYLRIILRFQKVFHSFFTDRFLYVQSEGEHLYFSTKKMENSMGNPTFAKPIPKEIELTQQEISLLNDIVYMFTKVKRGKGFNLQEYNSEIMKGIKSLRKNHPYLFFSNGHGLVYPTELTAELGAKINSYMKSNRRFEKILVANSTIIIKW